MKEQVSILLTGASGFVGQAILKQLQTNDSYKVTAALRTADNYSHSEAYAVGEFSSLTDWSTPLTNQHVVIHAAARTHTFKKGVNNSLAEYRRVNVDGTLNLARQAAEHGVKRFIFISSIKVNGEQTHAGFPFRAEDLPAPADTYAVSKYEAELGLMEIAEATEMEVVIIRPPLVFGPGVKGNFASLINIVRKGVPLPFGALSNKRSLIGIDNIVDLIITCVEHPKAANQILLASDGADLSTTELLKAVANTMGIKSRLIPIPGSILMFCASILGKRAVAHRLVGSLQVDISKTRELLDWEPPVSVEEGLHRCCVVKKS